jgi:mono/diheme cytochrome c family protein
MQNPANALIAAADRGGRFSLAIVLLFTISSHAQTATLATKLRPTRTSPLDLELSGDLANLPPNTTRYISREDLLSLPQTNFTASSDSNFTSPKTITGVSLDELTHQLSASPNSDLTIAICEDQYRANFPHAYINAHHPVLVLKINGQPPSGWPKDSEGHNADMGPYMISQPDFVPSFKILATPEEPQNPWGVIRLEFRDEATAFNAIAPRGSHAQDPQVQAGHRIAQQNCFRCHNMGAEGGQKAGHPWLVLSAWATAQPGYLAAYVHNPKQKNPNAQMPSFPEYDEATLRALTAYFQTFTTTITTGREKP